MKTKKESKKILPSMSTIVIALSVFIIAESIWLVGKLEEISKKASSGNNFPISVKQQPVENKSDAVISLKGPVQVNQGETLVVDVTLKANESFYAHGLDVVVDYDPQVLQALGEAQIDPSSPFKTAGLNIIEEGKKRILVTLIDMSGKGFTFTPGEEYSLFKLSFKALKSGETSLKTGSGEKESRKTQVIDANTGQLLLLDKEELTVVVY